ncbi:MAG: DNA recombination protein RmuC [Patescibacteria group bacterium]|nr:DNA recombination protein RmuC [Patescibacteria group bacterium]
MQNYLSMFLLLLLIALIILLAYFVFSKRNTDTNQDRGLKDLQTQVKEIQSELKSSLEKNLDFLQKQSGDSSRLIQSVTARLEQLDATNKQVVNFASQLQSLENILKNPKHRGILGEYFLESVLSNVLPPNHFTMQYAFKNGEIVDAAIFVRDKIIPIDAKFSLEKYNLIQEENDKVRRNLLEREFKQDLKLRIDETSKYIRPNENTTDFALMFIPAEGVYYSLLIATVGAVDVSSQNLIEYANSKKVVIVSPTTFIAYLQTILQALKALKVEENIKEVIAGLQKLNKHYLNFDNYLIKLGDQFGTVVNTYNSAYKEFAKINKDMNKLTGSEDLVEPKQLDKPADLS